MDITMRLYWDLYFKEVTTEEIIKKSSNPLRDYEAEFIDGAIVDIGCGQSDILLEYANSGRNLYAIDNEGLQLDLLMKRAKEISNNMQHWNFINGSIPKDKLPNDKYAVVVLSNLLHFFTLDSCREIENILCPKIEKGSFIYIVVHSDKHYKSNDPDKYDYFKHYFTIDDIYNVFDLEKYESVYVADIEKKDSKQKVDFLNKWLDLAYKFHGYTDQTEIDSLKQDYLSNKKESYLEVILRKK